MKTYLPYKLLIERDPERCIQCQVCVNQCTFDTHYYDAEDDEIRSHEENCAGCDPTVVSMLTKKTVEDDKREFCYNGV